MTAIDRAELFNNEHDRPITMACLRGTLFGQRAIANGEPHEATFSGNGMNPLDRGVALDEHLEMARMADEGNPHHEINQPARLFIPLDGDEIDAMASVPSYDFEGPFRFGNGVAIYPESICEEDRQRVRARRTELNNAAPEVASINTEAAQLLPGGVRIPQGFRLVGKVSYDDEMGRIDQEALRATCSFQDITPGVSATLQRAQYGSPQGFVTLRIIHDGAGVAYLFRKDEGDDTFFRVAFGHGAAA